MSEMLPNLTDELRANIHHDYRLIRSMKAPKQIKRKFLTDLFSQFHYNWKVVGITPKALAIFKDYEFHQKPRMGITRAHLNDRNRFFDEMLDDELSEEQMWRTYWENDRTVLAGTRDDIRSFIAIDFRLGLFKDRCPGWTHREAERSFLAELWSKHSLG